MKEDEYGVIRIAGHFDDSQSALVLHLRTQSHSIMKKHSHFFGRKILPASFHRILIKYNIL